MLTPERKPFHIPTERGRVGRYCILPGAPERVPLIASMLDRPEHIGANREFTVWNGWLGETLVTVCSTGIGGPSAAIAAEELADCGADTMIRVGTCGGIALPVQSGRASENKKPPLNMLRLKLVVTSVDGSKQLSDAPDTSHRRPCLSSAIDMTTSLARPCSVVYGQKESVSESRSRLSTRQRPPP